MLDFVKVTEAAALAAARLMGRGDNDAADRAAVEAMRAALGELDIQGRVVIGEGERDEAPMLFIGEVVGSGRGYEVDIAVDPVEGTNLVAKGLPNAISVIAVSERGGILHAPDVYMEKLVVGPSAAGRVDLRWPVARNLATIASSLRRRVEDVTVVILDRPRHAELIEEVRQAGARIKLISDDDVLVWESDLVRAGLLQQALDLLGRTPYVLRPEAGKYAGAVVLDTSSFVQGLEDPYLVLVRSDGTATYPAKDIAFQFWKMGLLGGLGFVHFEDQPSGRPLYTSHPRGDPALGFGGCEETINVIDATQSYPQLVVRTALAIAGRPDLAERAHHLAYETVTLEGRRISGRRGHTVSVDEVLDEARRRARAIMAEKNPDHPDPDFVAEQVGVGAIRFAMVKTEPRRQIDFRWEQALSFEGDSGPYVQYAHARAASLLRRAGEAGVADEPPDFSQVTEFERPVARTLLDFPQAVADSAAQRTPHVLAQYLLDLAAVWNAYYNARSPDGTPATSVLLAPPGLRGARLALVAQVREVLRTGLGLLGVPAPDEM